MTDSPTEALLAQLETLSEPNHSIDQYVHAHLHKQSFDAITELQRQLTLMGYEWEGVHKKLEQLRKRRDEIVRILDTPTASENLDAGGSIFDMLPDGTYPVRK